MSVTMISRMIKRRWWLVTLPFVISLLSAIPALVDGASSSAGGFSAEIRYSAAQELILPQRDGDYQDVWLASELTVNAFSDWVRSSSFRREIFAHLGDADVDAAALSIAADNARSIGVIYLSHGDASALQKISSAAVAVLSQRNQTYFPQLGGEAAQVTILEAPVIAPLPPAISNRVAPLIQIAVGIFIGVVLAFFAEYLDPSIHDQEDLRRLGLPVVANIPRSSARRTR